MEQTVYLVEAFHWNVETQMPMAHFTNHVFTDYSDALESFRMTYRKVGGISTNTFSTHTAVVLERSHDGSRRTTLVGYIRPVNKMVHNHRPTHF